MGETAERHPLDDPVRSALTGPHAHLAQRRGRILRYPPELMRFIALPDTLTASDWADVVALVGPEQIPIAGKVVAPRDGWELTSVGPGLQMVDDGTVEARTDAEAVVLGRADHAGIVDLVARNRGGREFTPRTLELGTYLGFRRDGALVAMAGERLRPTGWSELSSICTDAAHRRQGLARRLVLALLAVIRERGDTAFLHVEHDNVAALNLYRGLGFRVRREISMAVVHIPREHRSPGEHG